MGPCSQETSTRLAYLFKVRLRSFFRVRNENASGPWTPLSIYRGLDRIVRVSPVTVMSRQVQAKEGGKVVKECEESPLLGRVAGRGTLAPIERLNSGLDRNGGRIAHYYR